MIFQIACKAANGTMQVEVSFLLEMNGGDDHDENSGFG